jgi:hypothetical protein
VVDDEIRTVARQSVGDRPPDAPFGSGNDRDSAGEGSAPLFEGLIATQLLKVWGGSPDDILDGGCQAGCGAALGEPPGCPTGHYDRDA